MPAPTVTFAGRPTVSSGSQITICGIIFGWKITFLVWVVSSVITPARPTSEPVPAVVGTAMIGAMPEGSARVHQSPISSKSHIGRLCPAMKATTLPQSSAEPPPKAMTPSLPLSRRTFSPSSTFAATGLAWTRSNSVTLSPSAASCAMASLIIGRPERPESVTSSGRSMPAARQACASSAMRPGPKRTAVG